MADNTLLNSGSGGDTIRDIDRGTGAKTQVVQLDQGGGTGLPESLVTALNPLNVSDLQGAEAQSADQPYFVAITGDPNGDFAGVNLLEQVIDTGSGLKLNVQTQQTLKTDTNNALVLSDGVQYSVGAGQTAIFDTTGYATLFLQINTGTLTSIASSADGITFYNHSLQQTTGANVGNSSLGVGSWHCATENKLFKIVMAAASTAVVTLRQAPFSPAISNSGLGITNITHIGGTAVGTAASGVLAIGGNTSVGSSPNSQPVLVSGVDSSNLIRKILTDTPGRVMVGSQTGTGNIQNQPPVFTTDIEQFEGQTKLEILAQILAELRVVSMQLSQLPIYLNAGVSVTDEPSVLRSDPSITTLIN